MKRHQIAANRKRKFVVTTDSNHDLPVAENKLSQDFTPSHPNQKWVTDITYIWTTEGWLYLAVVLERSAAAVVFPKSSWLVDECQYGKRACNQ
jgi:transposase InsO family protein